MPQGPLIFLYSSTAGGGVIVVLGSGYSDSYGTPYGDVLSPVVSVPTPTIVIGGGPITANPTKIGVTVSVPTPTVVVPVSTLFPGLLVELDTGGWIIGPELDDPVSAALNTAVLGPVPPTFPDDISQPFRSGDINRGAQRELQRIEAGTASAVFDDRDGRFTYPNLLPMMRIRFRATFGGNTYPIFSGFVESVPVGFNDTDTTVTVSLVDGFTVLSRNLISGDFIEQASGARVTAILDAVKWSDVDRDIEPGVVTVPAITLENVSALEHLQQIAHAEGGRFFIGRDGKAVFRDRTAATNPDFSDRTWADDGTGMSYRDVVIVVDDDLIFNDIRLMRDGGVEQVASDGSSQNSYGVRSLAETGIQLSDDTQVGDLASVLLERYAQPAPRLESLVDNAMQHHHWERVLARELNDYALAIETRTATAQVSTIEGIVHSIGQDTWTVTLSLSPTVIEQAGILDDATYGLLDSTAILAR